MSTFDPIAHLVADTERVAARLINDLNAIPDDHEDHCPGGCARSGVNIVAECAVVNRAVATFLATGTAVRPKPEERDALIASYDTKAKAREFLSQETAKLIEAIKSLDPETLGETVNFFPTRTTDRFAVASLPAGHMAYHDGQLNYIQTLYGDNQIHW